MSYWGRVFVRAVHEAAKNAKLDTWANALTVISTQLLISAIIWIAYGYALPNGTLMMRVLTTITPFLIFPIAFIVRFFVVPSEMAREDAVRLAFLEDGRKEKERRKVVKDIIGSCIEEGEEIFGHPNTKRGDAMQDAAEQWVTKTHNFISTAFCSGEATLFLSDAGYTIYSSDGVVGNWIKGRLRRLNELLVRTDSIDINIDFDPTIWG
jgi:hypothetical protein